LKRVRLSELAAQALTPNTPDLLRAKSPRGSRGAHQGAPQEGIVDFVPVRDAFASGRRVPQQATNLTVAEELAA